MKDSNWKHFKKHYFFFEKLDFALDISCVDFPLNYFVQIEDKWQHAYTSMEQLENGALSNPDEKRMVGHYWLRNPSIAPTEIIRNDIEKTLAQIIDFAEKVHKGEIRGAAGPFKNFICIGIGGSALGPQFVAHALGEPQKNPLTAYFIDNTDPDGIDLVLKQLEGELGRTLTILISKSGSTPEPNNGKAEVKACYEKAGFNFAQHSVCITKAGSKLDQYAQKKGLLARFPMWDWIGGRTSELSAVGLLPAALQGIDIKNLLAGARDMDTCTRTKSLFKNPAAILALTWYALTKGEGSSKAMVLLPYKDRLLLFSRYLQQLVMESLGKEKDLQGNIVSQGLTVYGNKGSTDQHAYVQQLRDGPPNFFVTFIEVLKDRKTRSIEVAPDITTGDYLEAFFLGTRISLQEKKRPSITLTLKEVSPYTIGMLIALYERTVGYYASFIGINAYHQPGVEAGKKAADSLLNIQQKMMNELRTNPGKPFQAEELAASLQLKAQTALLFKLLEHMAANPDKNILKEPNNPFYRNTYRFDPKNDKKN